MTLTSLFRRGPRPTRPSRRIRPNDQTSDITGAFSIRDWADLPVHHPRDGSAAR